MNKTLKSFFSIAYSNISNHQYIVRDLRYFLNSLEISDVIIALEGDFVLTKSQIKKIENFFQLYLDGVPLDYILKESIFYGNSFFVDPRVLIPRQETELIVDWTLDLKLKKNSMIAEVGTGSGCIAISIALKKPTINIIATDISVAALEVAYQNILSHNVKNITLVQSNWISCIGYETLDAIISNPPYLHQNDPHLKDLQHEPQISLISQDGLQSFYEIASQAIHSLKIGGKIVFEHGFSQANEVSGILKEFGFANIVSNRDFQGFNRYTHAEKL